VSITQFIGIVSLFSTAISTAGQVALYEPLAERDMDRISGIIAAIKSNMRKTGIFGILAIIAFAALYATLVGNEFDWFFIFTFVLIISVNTFLQSFFGVSYWTLLRADQREYVNMVVHMFAVVINTVAATILILAGGEIRVVMLVSSLVFGTKPLFLYLYVRKRYKLTNPIQPKIDALKDRQASIILCVASYIQQNTGVILLTLFSNMKEISVFAIYIMVIRHISAVITGFIGGMEAPFGNMLARDEKENIRSNLIIFEFVAFSLFAVFLTCTISLISPFMSVYTLGIDDVSYYRPAFAVVLCIAEMGRTLVKPYYTLTLAARRLQKIRDIEMWMAFVSISVSLVLVKRYGITGVAVGLLCSIIFGVFGYAFYMSRHVVRRSLLIVAWKVFLSAATIAVILVIVRLLPEMKDTTYAAWILYAFLVFCTAAGVVTASTVLFYRKESRMLMIKIRKAVQKRA
jgi:O-antigen/teichoic acid export membrane protein